MKTSAVIIRPFGGGLQGGCGFFTKILRKKTDIYNENPGFFTVMPKSSILPEKLPIRFMTIIIRGSGFKKSRYPEIFECAIG
jgi:hypothetical protein